MSPAAPKKQRLWPENPRLVLLGRGILPGIWIGAALVNLTVESSPLAAAFSASGNTLEALAGSAVIWRYIGVPFRFERGST